LLSLPNLTSADSSQAYEQYLAKSVTKPSFQVSEKDHKFLGNTYYYPGIVTWGTVSAVIVNAINPDGNKVIYDALEKSGYLKPPDQQGVFDNAAQAPGTVNKADAVRALGNVYIEELNGSGGLIGTWTLQNAFITDAKFGDLTYDDDTLLNIDLTFRYDWAEYLSGPAVAAAVDL
jgi:hypothetical protein